MGLQLPEKRYSAAPVRQKRNVPVDQIIATMGQNPVAQGIASASDVLLKAIEKRAEMRRKALEVAALSKATGVDLSGIEDPSIAAGIAKNVGDRKSEEARAQEANRIREEGDRANRDLRMLMAQSLEEHRRETRNRLSEQFRERQVNTYKQGLEKTGIPGAIASAQGVLSQLPDRGEDIPGFGPLAGGLPDIMVSQSGKDLRQSVHQLFNTELRSRSGTAVTDNELQRLKAEFGTGKWKTDEQLRTGVRQYLLRLQEIARNEDAGVSPLTRQAYMENGGNDIPSQFGKMIQTPSIRPPQKTNFRNKYGY